MCKVKPDNATLLGAPIGQLNSINSAILGRLQALKTMGSRLSHFRRQDPLLLLRQSVAIPKILYTLRTAPCCISPELASFDQEAINLAYLECQHDNTQLGYKPPFLSEWRFGRSEGPPSLPLRLLTSLLRCKDL